ncbi:MAG: MFS transporter [Candidatus Saccharibacteria bacterium]
MKISSVHKIYASNFLTGLVFWYSIEKLFMRSIDIGAVGVGVLTAIFIVFLVIFDIPAGMLADKWSRKGMLLVAALGLALSSLVFGKSHSASVYLIGELLYGLYIVSAGGTYQAIMYDTLHEDGKAAQYSRINGRAYALFLLAAGIGDLAGGFVVHHYGYRMAFYATIGSCLLNVLVILSMHEPRFHKALDKDRPLQQVGQAAMTIARMRLLQGLVVVMTMFAVIELFKLDFGQLYILRYVTAPQVIGILWAVYAFAMSLGSLIAHRFRARLHTLIACSVVPLVLMAFIDNRFSIVLFMIQAVASSALLNQIETRIQESTPSHARTAVLSVVSTMGRLATIPASLLLGWLFQKYNALVAIRCVAAFAVCILLYWIWVSRNMPVANEPTIAD